MLLFEWTVVLLLVAVLLAALARRIGAPYPAFLAVAGAALAFIPGGPRIALDPELALALFVAPVLLDAAFDASPRDLRRNWASVGGLVLVAVAVTTVAAAWAAHALVPGLPWAAAIALGAIVAPPDAAAATAVLRQVRPPHRIMTILEGESLLNDASALLIYRVAVAAALGASFSAASTIPTLAVVLVGSIALGFVLARLQLALTGRVEDVPSSVILQFVGTFAVWLLAERLGLSAVLTIVVFASTVSRRAPDLVPSRLRVPSYAVWDTVTFVLNVLAFLLIGLQIRPIVERLDLGARREYVLVAVAVLAAVIASRAAWVLAYDGVARWRSRRRAAATDGAAAPGPAGGVVIAWCGMRGIVTLAAALALPDGRDGPVFPYRDLLVLTAFCVVVGTLTLQGLTLKPLLRRLDLHDDGPVEREVSTARDAVMAAVVTRLGAELAPDAAAVEIATLRREYDIALARASARPGAEPTDAVTSDGPRRRAVTAARQAISDLRRRGEIGDEAFHRVEEQLDWIELSAGGAQAPSAGDDAPAAVR